jgi:hypothetical protein
MYLSDTEYQELIERIEWLENCLPTACELDAILHDRVLGCITEEESAAAVGDYDDGDGLLDPDLFVEVATHHSEGEIWLHDAHESLTLEEFVTFLQTWLKIIDDEDGLESLLTLGAVLMRKERGRITGDMKQVRDIRAKLFKRVEQLDEYV